MANLSADAAFTLDHLGEALNNPALDDASKAVLYRLAAEIVRDDLA